MKKRLVAGCMLIFALSFLVSAQELALDIKTSKQIYSAGENLSYEVLLLDGNAPVSDTVKVFLSDINGKKVLDFDVTSNQDNEVVIEKDFPSGYWKIEASYGDKTVKRFFTIGEREEADFSIEGDTLIIRNSGNVPYTKTVQILIGEKVISQKQYVEIGEFKQIKLVAPDGKYNVQVSDGVKSISKSDLYLTGTGRVIGALDEDIAESQPTLGGARDVQGESFFTGNNFSIAFVFIGAVFGLFILLFIERRMQHQRASMASNMVKLH